MEFVWRGMNYKYCDCYYKMEGDQYERESECEDYVDYGPDGYHPVHIGEKFSNNTYTVVQKLGWGHFSTVWLAYKQSTKEHLALKIQRSKQSHTQSAVDELQMLTEICKHESQPQWLQFLANYQKEHPTVVNSKLCRPLLLTDNFVHYGIHGKHMCSVFELMGPNLLDLIQHYEFKDKRMPLWLVKKIARDVLFGLVYLHEKCRIIHTDLKPENIMIKMESSEEQELIEQLKGYNVKPLSMKYLKNLQASKNPKNKKKLEKKKLKKKKQLQNQNGEKDSDQEHQSEVSQSINHKQESSNSASSYSQAQSESYPAYPGSSPIQHQKIQSKQQQQSNKIVEQKLPVIQNVVGEAKQIILQPQAVKQQQSKDIEGNKQDYTDIQDGVDMSTLVWKNVKIKLNNKLFFKIADMGNACFTDKHFTDDIQTRQYRSPEVIIGHQYYYNTDIFSLACVIFELMTNNFLFKPKKISGIKKDEDHLYQMLETLGPIDKDFCLNGKHSGQLFNKKGKLLNGHPKDISPISKQLIQKYDYHPEVAVAAEEFLLPMLAYEPKNRIEARACLKSKWLWN